MQSTPNSMAVAINGNIHTARLKSISISQYSPCKYQAMLIINPMASALNACCCCCWLHSAHSISVSGCISAIAKVRTTCTYSHDKRKKKKATTSESQTYCKYHSTILASNQAPSNRKKTSFTPALVEAVPACFTCTKQLKVTSHTHTPAAQKATNPAHLSTAFEKKQNASSAIHTNFRTSFFSVSFGETLV
jgi:hypothetical protein